ncbi:MAG: Gfo/Idh/MocA family oxidoreductase [Candidatus Izemoplasmatales bacterium]|nr:Gfo/Idh/MocA family oxidoreductase [Candidatus Izemoplasmatales bacterium]
MIKAILIGAGGRGIGAYGEYAIKNPNDIKFIAVADPDIERRMYFSYRHGIAPENQFSSYEEILRLPKMADTCFICTQDTLHIQPAKLALKKGYDVFLEKPMAVYPEDCVLLEEIAKKENRKLMIGHVLRYTQFFSAIKELVDSGKIGSLMTIQHNENVSFWHQAHSYVRGNWRNVETSSPMILAKSCHDLDILYWLSNSTPIKVASFGSLSYFKESSAPIGAPKYCMDGCPKESECAYFAPKVYLNAPDWMKLPVSNKMTDEDILAALKKGPYGRCVYRSDNDVVDHQVVIIEFENQMTASFTMTAFTHENTRTIKLMGTLGEIRGHMDKQEIEIYTFGNDIPEVIHLETLDYGHGGGDYGIMKAFVRLIEIGDNQEIASDEASVMSHLLAFAAEKSRLESKSIDFIQYVKDIKKNA